MDRSVRDSRRRQGWMMPIKTDPDLFSIRPRRTSPDPRAIVARRLEDSGPYNTLNLYSSPVVIEYQDTFFHSDSAVMMPDTAGEPGHTLPERVMDDALRRDLERSHPGSYLHFSTTPYDPPNGDGPERVSGLGVIAASYRFLKANDGYKLLIAGHCDTAGAVDYNFNLSKLRAQNVLHLLLGEKEPWIDTCKQKSHVEDWQRILKHVARVFGWPCDPGAIDNRDGPDTQRAVRAFQTRYNAEFGQAISVDGVVGRETWGAFFEVYLKELAAILGTDTQGLAAERVVRFLDDSQKYIACGEQVPIDAPARDNFRSAANRRVELLYFKPPRVPDLSCHRGTNPFCMKSCARTSCGVYAAGRFQFVYLDPVLADGKITNRTTSGRYSMHTIDDDLSEVLTDEDRAPLTLTLSGDTEQSDDLWAFLDPFEASEPEDGSREVSPSRGVV